MKLKKVIYLFLIFLANSALFAQAPQIEWQKCFGGSGTDEAKSIIETKDGGYIIAGTTQSKDGDISGYHGREDCWIVKLNQVGVIQWQKCFGGTKNDRAYSITETKDGGYIIAGYSDSNDEDVTGNHGDDCWIVKINQVGVIQWQKCFGGTSYDGALAITETKDGGYIVAGYTYSNDGEVTSNRGGEDYWIIKLSQNGDLIWQKCYGGTSQDVAISIIETKDGGYIVAGITESNDGDVTGHYAGLDYWIVKINQNGDLIWQKCYGGDIFDYAMSILETKDGGYIVAGYTNSRGPNINNYHGGADYWIIKLSQNGDLIWQKCYGGTHDDIAKSIKETKDGGYIVAGYTNSRDGDVSGIHGDYVTESDSWIVKINQSGDLLWQKCLGGSFDEYAMSIIETKDGGYIVAGITESNDGDVTGYHGMEDFWVVKLSPETAVEESKTKEQEELSISPNPVTDYLYLNNISSNFQIEKIQIFSALGIKLLEIEYKDRIDVSALAPGVYFVKVGEKVEKFVKI